MTPEPEVVQAPTEVTITTTQAGADSSSLNELSKRVDQTHDLSMLTHDLVIGLDTRFESHRVTMGHAVAEIAQGVADIKNVQAEEAGRKSESEKREDRRHRRKANLIAVASAAATIASTAALVLSIVVH